jgi:hypothetical protein
MKSREYAQHVCEIFGRTFVCSHPISEPPSYYSEDAQCIDSEPDLEFALRLFLHWAPFKERYAKGWTWFAPHHILRRPGESSYILAGRPGHFIEYDHGHYIVDGHTYESLMDVIYST